MPNQRRKPDARKPDAKKSNRQKLPLQKAQMTPLQISRLEEQLRRAIIAGRTARVRTLLQNHPWLIETTFEYEDIHQVYSPLHLAAIYGKYALIKLLLEIGADVMARTRTERLPLYYAANYTPPPLSHAARMTRALLEAMQQVIPDEWQQAAVLVETMAQLLADSETGAFSMMVLEAANANLEAHDRQGRSALHHAVLAGNIDAFDMLHELGAEPDPADKQGNTPLHLAVWSGSTVLVATALKQECEPLHQNDDGVSPYQAAIQSGSVMMLGLFHRHPDVQKQMEGRGGQVKRDFPSHNFLHNDNSEDLDEGDLDDDELDEKVGEELRRHYRAQWQAHQSSEISDLERYEEHHDRSTEWFWDEEEPEE
jgi:hypothetical protein